MDHTDFPEVGENEKTESEMLHDQVVQQLADTRQAYKEIVMLYEQSELEVNKLTQRNSTATGTLQRVQSQFERLPREEIRSAYDAVLDAQQRLFVVRGQVEKLQSEKGHLEKEIELLEIVDSLLSEQPLLIESSQPSTNTTELLESLIQAQEAERLRLSRQMHDGPAQALSNLILETEIAMRLFDVNKEQAYQELTALRDSASKTFEQVRDFIFELRPMMLDDLGLIPTIKKYTSAVQDHTGTTIRCGVTGPERRMESYMEVMVFRAIQELLRNAIDHSQASQIDVQIDVGDSFVTVMVEDNGSGFEIEALEDARGMGLKVIRDRVEMTNGDFEIISEIGEGTKVTFTVLESALETDEANLS